MSLVYTNGYLNSQTIVKGAYFSRVSGVKELYIVPNPSNENKITLEIVHDGVIVEYYITNIPLLLNNINYNYLTVKIIEDNDSNQSVNVYYLLQ